MPLERYNRKRDFRETPEPAGVVPDGSPAPPGRRFVVQRHRATRLHYDFRLEIDGVLASWAVPKGPSLDSSVRRMAVHVEDHPLEYFDFEGVIPRGQYGAGDVIVWDWGTYDPEAETPDPAVAIRDGELKFRLQGEKLKGRFTLVRTSGRGGGRAGSPEGEVEQWLLIHKRDELATPGWDAEQLPYSVKTGRTNDDVREQRNAVWVSRAPASQAEIDLAGAKDAEMPEFIPPMLATLTDRPFSDPDWLFEIKWDGYRMEAVVRDGTVRLWTRNGNDGETYFPGLLSPPSWIDAREAIVDGEVVALAPDGRPDFGLLQERIGRGRTPPPPGSGPEAPLVYQVFDLLYLDGRSLLGVHLEDRKRLLRSVLREQARVRFAAHVERDGEAFFAAAKNHDLEGIIAKHRGGLYEPGRRSSTWLKVKVRPEQELVVGGYLPGEGAHTELGAVLVGVYDGGHLRYAGRVGSGIDTKTRRSLRERLDATLRETSPFEPAPARKGDLREARWVDPGIVIRAEFSNWTRDDLVRQAAFKGFEPEKDPRSVIRERAIPVAGARPEAERSLGEPGAPATGRQQATIQPPDEATDVVANLPASRRANRRTNGATTEPAHRPPDEATDVVADPPAPPPRTSPVLPSAATPSEIAALERMGSHGLWAVGGRELKLTNLDKVLFPPGRDESTAVTKRELIRYFALIAPAMLPHLAERPLNLHRYPNGPGAPGFWQKDIPDSAPKWLTIWHETGVADQRKANDHLVADQVATLCWLGNQAAFEIHAWTGRLPDPWRPTFALIDIDPGPRTTWADIVTIATLYRTALDYLKVRAYPKVTGRRGIQAWIPIVPRYDFSETSAWVAQVSRAVGDMVPDLVSWEWSVAQRRGLARLDYTQNAAIKTLVAPYAVRPADGAPVSAPITWDELDDPDLRPDRWTVRSILPRVAARGDLWAPLLNDQQVLPAL